MDAHKNILETLEQWFETPEGKAEIEQINKKHARLKSFHDRFATRIPQIPVERQDQLMRAIIDHYQSDRYNDRWYGRGIFPPFTMFDWIYRFIVNHGCQIGEVPGGGYVYQYNHWKVSSVCGQGQTHYDFVYTEETPHVHGDAYVYGAYVKNIEDGSIQDIVRKWFKSYNEAKEFCEKSKPKVGLVMEPFLMVNQNMQRECEDTFYELDG